MEWKGLFQNSILERGYEYYQSGMIQHIQSSDKEVGATVEGENDYHVHITFLDGEVASLSCTCCVAKKGTPCKHMAAVLYHQEDTTSKKADNQYLKAVQKADEKIKDEFLQTLLAKDDKLYYQFLLQTNQAFDLQQYLKSMDKSMRPFQNIFVDYSYAGKMFKILEEYVFKNIDKFIINEQYDDVLEILMHGYDLMYNIEFDDSDGYATDFLDQMVSVLDCIYYKVDHHKLLHWLFDIVREDDYDYGYTFEDYIMAYFHEEDELQLKLQYIKECIENAGQYSQEDWVIQYLRVMEELHMDLNKCLETAYTYIQHDKVKEYYVDLLIKGNKYDEAIKIVNQHGKENVHLLLKIKEVYRITNDMLHYKEVMFDLLTKHKPGNLDLYRELKACYTRENWLEMRQLILSAMKRNKDIIYKEEGMLEELLAFVRKAGIAELNKYKNDLKNQYPQQILDLYTQYLNNQPKGSQTRKVYRHWCSILEEMKSIQGGQVQVEQIKKNWQTIYAKRPSLMDELRNV